jgi:hypothetical protein
MRAVGVRRFLKADARGAVELADDDALGAVDDEAALLGHERDFAHVNGFFAVLVAFLEAKGDMQRRGEGAAFLEGVHPGALDFADVVTHEVQRALPVVAFDREHFLEDGLEADVFAFVGGNAGLQELLVGINLDLDQIRGGNDFLDLAMALAVNHARTRGSGV